MKTKYLFYSLALAGAFTACSQEELIEAPVANDNVASRPVAGLVEFSTEGVESRFNHETASWQNGDVFGLYLMDEFKQETYGACAGEHVNANEYLTKKLDGVVDEVNGYSLWAYQDHWFGMYKFTNNIQSNYPFTYSTSDEKWTNDAKLVEGNYFAMYPQNEKALNRRELWHQIDPSVTLKKHSKYETTRKKTFVNLDNQFFLGYSQIYRNETSSAEGVLKMDLSLKGAMVPVKLMLQGFSNNDVKLDKIEFKSSTGNGKMPTLAFIEPLQKDAEGIITDWVEVTPKVGYPYMNWYEKNCNVPHGLGLYDEDLTWTRQTIQSLISWEDGTNRVPYGCKEENAYSYSFEFPGEFADKVKLEGLKNETVYAYFALPAINWTNVYALVYGWQLMNEGTQDEHWEYGILTNLKLNGQDATIDNSEVNKSFALNNALKDAWTVSENNYFLEIKANYDNYGWVAVNEAVVTGTEQMTNLIKGRVQQASSGDEVKITVKPDANGVEVKQELINWLIVEAKKYKDIEITFDGGRGGIVYFNENNTLGIDTDAAGEQYNVKFSYKNGITLVNNAAEQIIPHTYNSDELAVDGSVVVLNKKNLKVLGKLENVENYGEMVVACQKINGVEYSGEAEKIDNQNNLVLEAGAVVTTLNNEPKAKVTITAPTWNMANVTTLNNKAGVVDCADCHTAEVIVNGELSAGRIENAAVVTVNGKLTLTNALYNDPTDVHAWKAVVYNYGEIVGKVENSGVIVNGSAEGKSGIFDGLVNNYYKVDAYAGEFNDLKPGEGSVLNVWSEDADVEINDETNRNYYIILKGIVAQHIDNQAKGIKIFELTQEERLIDLMTKMYYTGATYIKTSKNIIFEEYNEDPAIYAIVSPTMAKIEYVYVDGADVIFKEDVPSTWDWNWSNATLEVKAPENGKEYRLSIEDGTSINVKEVKVADKKYLHVATGSQLKDANGVIDHNGSVSVDDFTGGAAQQGGDNNTSSADPV